MNDNYDITWREVIWERPFEFQSVLELLTHLATHQSRGTLIWEVRASGGKIKYLIGAEHRYIRSIENIFRSYGNIRFVRDEILRRKKIDTAKRLQISKPVLSLKVTESIAVTRAVLIALTQVRENEEVVVQIVLGRSFLPGTLPNKIPDPHASLLSIVTGNVAPASNESRQSIRDKMTSHRLSCTVRIGAASNTNAQDIYIRNVLSALRVLESSGVGMRLINEKSELLNNAVAPWRYPLRLSVKELANLFLLPVGKESLPGTSELHPKFILAPEWMQSPNPKERRSFAVNVSPKDRIDEHKDTKVLNISPKDSLEHTVILGPTGSGKSNVMLSLIMQDIRAGRNVLVIDPKTDLVNDILARIPDSRSEDVVIIDPSDPCPVGFNPFSFSHKQSPELIADTILAALKDIFSDNWGIRSQDILSSALLTLAQTENASLLMLPPLLTDTNFRRKITANLNDKIGLEPFWHNFNALSKAERNQMISPVLNKIRQFLLRPALRNVLGQASPKFNLSDLFYTRKIILVPLNKGIIGAESAQLLGSLIVGLTWTLALSRAKIAPERRHIVSVFIDELQDYLRLPTNLSDALAQARGLGVGITLAHQYRSQLSFSVKTGIDANARNKIIFGLNVGDAKEMASMAIGLEAEDFMLLPRYHVYSNLMVSGKQTGWISGKTYPPEVALHDASELRAISMKRYGKPAHLIEEEYLDLLGYTNANDTEEDISANIGRVKRGNIDDSKDNNADEP